MAVLHSSSTQIRVRYGETDQMGFVYYGNYAQYYEVARVEMLRDLGMPYQRMEAEGTMLPVYDMHVRFIAPAKYDDLLTIHTDLLKCAGSRLVFAYRLLNQSGDLLNEAETTLVFVDKESGKPTRVPAALLQLLSKSSN